MILNYKEAHFRYFMQIFIVTCTTITNIPQHKGALESSCRKEYNINQLYIVNKFASQDFSSNSIMCALS